MPPGPNSCPDTRLLEVFPEVEIVIPIWLNPTVLLDPGLNVHAVPTGNPPQLKVTAPRELSSSSSVKVNCPEPPAVTDCEPACGVITIGGPRLMLSVAVLLLGFTSPPPETLAVLVKLFTILIGIFTVNVIGG